jgi:hypothetical protein
MRAAATCDVKAALLCPPDPHLAWGMSEGAGKQLSTGRGHSLLVIIVGVFVVLHGLVHLLYFGQSARLFELQPGMVWPGGSWAFSKLLGEEATRWLASVCCVLAAVAFVAGATGIFVRQAWWRPVVAGSAAFSTAVFVLFWDGGMQKLDQKGGVALLINLAILTAVLALRWPDIE